MAPVTHIPRWYEARATLGDQSKTENAWQRHTGLSRTNICGAQPTLTLKHTRSPAADSVHRCWRHRPCQRCVFMDGGEARGTRSQPAKALFAASPRLAHVHMCIHPGPEAAPRALPLAPGFLNNNTHTSSPPDLAFAPCVHTTPLQEQTTWRRDDGPNCRGKSSSGLGAPVRVAQSPPFLPVCERTVHSWTVPCHGTHGPWVPASLQTHREPSLHGARLVRTMPGAHHAGTSCFTPAGTT